MPLTCLLSVTAYEGDKHCM